MTSNITASAYKAAKEAFVSGTSGSSLTRINLISSVALSSLILHHSYLYISARAPISSRGATGIKIINNFFIQWLLIVFPLLASITTWFGNSRSVGLFSATLFLNGATITLYTPRYWPRSIVVQQVDKICKYEDSGEGKSNSKSTKIPGLTVYRSHMLLLTSLCILAVDFPLFPRELAKCETFGTSLMDIGVGSFVFSQGIVSAKGYLNLTSKTPQMRNLTSHIRELWHLLRKTLPLFVLGLLRILLVKGVEYPEHASEYGTHWNFFFTLFLVPILESILRPVLSIFSSAYRATGPALAGLGISFIHMLFLTQTSLQVWTLSTPRVDLLTHNKEGIVSLPGYLALHILGLSTGIILFFPYHIGQNQSKEGQGHQQAAEEKSNVSGFFRPGDQKWNRSLILLEKLFMSSVTFWSLFFVVVFFYGQGASSVSRRLANLPYVLWTSAYNTSFIFSYILVDLFFAYRSISPSHFDKGQPSDDTEQQSPLLNAINKHGLVFFLIANVLTGLTNLLLPTLYASDYVAALVWSVYTMTCCGIVWILEWRSASERSVVDSKEKSKL